MSNSIQCVPGWSRASDYPWSSAVAHCGLRDDGLLVPLPPRSLRTDWAAWLAGEDPVENIRIRQHTLQGAPCGDASFLAKIATQLGRPLQMRPSGRPR